MGILMSCERNRIAQLALSVLMTAFAHGYEGCSIPCIDPNQESTSRPQVDPAYNYPARIETQRPWNVYTELRFNYWQPSQENMELGQLNGGTTETAVTSGGSTTSLAISGSFQAINMDFDFKPGFTVALGYNFVHDNWDLVASYTWFHNTNKHSATATGFILYDSDTPGISPTWGIFVESDEDVYYQSASEKWKLGMDIIDLDLGRWYYVGCKLTVHPSLGARAALIQQHVHVSYINGFVSFDVDVPGFVDSSGFLVERKDVYNTSRSWGIGPKAALETNWMLGWGFRLFGNGEADILYTRYSPLKIKSVASGTVVGTVDLVPFNFALTGNTTGDQKGVDYLRTHCNLQLGFGWGTHFRKNKGHIDCTAGYALEVYFDQNMLRHDVTDPGGSIPNGNLYINGLVANMRFDF